MEGRLTRLRRGPKPSQAVFVLLSVWGCGEVSPPRAVDAPSAQELRLENVSVLRWGQGGEPRGPRGPGQPEAPPRADVLQLSAHAGRASLDRARREIRAEDVSVDAFSRGQERVGRLHAETATADVDAERLVASGHVRITDDVGRVIETRQVIYTPRDQRVVAPTPVVLRGENFELRAPRVTLDLEARQLEIAGPTEAKIEPQRRER